MGRNRANAMNKTGRRNGRRTNSGLSLPLLIALLALLVCILIMAVLLLAGVIRHSPSPEQSGTDSGLHMPADSANASGQDGAPDVPAMPSVTSSIVSFAPTVTAVPDVPSATAMPDAPSATTAPDAPSATAMPDAPSATTAPDAPFATAVPATLPVAGTLPDGEHVLKWVRFEDVTQEDDFYSVYAEWLPQESITMTEEQMRSLKAGDVIETAEETIVIKNVADISYPRSDNAFLFGDDDLLFIDNYWHVDDGSFDDNASLHGIGINEYNRRGNTFYHYFILYSERTKRWHLMSAWSDPDPSVAPMSSAKLTAGTLQMRPDLLVYVSNNFFGESERIIPPYAIVKHYDPDDTYYSDIWIPISCMQQYWREDRDMLLLGAVDYAVITVTVKNGVTVAMYLSYQP